MALDSTTTRDWGRGRGRGRHFAGELFTLVSPSPRGVDEDWAGGRKGFLPSSSPAAQRIERQRTTRRAAGQRQELTAALSTPQIRWLFVGYNKPLRVFSELALLEVAWDLRRLRGLGIITRKPYQPCWAWVECGRLPDVPLT